MDIRKVKKLIELLKESGVSEIEIHEGEESVRISTHSTSKVQEIMTQPAVAIPHPSPNADAAEVPEAVTDDFHTIKSPMVGTFYSSPSPNDAAFVAVGQAVNKGDILCIVEAMKIMNHIESDTSGIIERILVDNGEAVEYGQPLFAIK